MSGQAALREASYRARFLIVVVLPGAVLMALEIVSSRQLAPKFGNSVYVWGSIIGVFLAAMSAGYVAGGRWADRSPRLPALGGLLLLAALFQWVTALVGRMVVSTLGSWTSGHPAGTLIATAVLFGPATFCLATVAPFAIRIASRDPQHLGGLAGRLYALSTFGSLAGTLTATFVLIPALALEPILALLVSVSALSAALCADRGAKLPLIVALWSRPARGSRRVRIPDEPVCSPSGSRPTRHLSCARAAGSACSCRTARFMVRCGSTPVNRRSPISRARLRLGSSSQRSSASSCSVWALAESATTWGAASRRSP